MAKLILPGGTDVAELALFSVDALPAQRAEPAQLKGLENGHSLLRIPTKADGAYLLHVYLDEPIPDGIKKHCVAPKRASLHLAHGRIGFGGVESAFSGFAPNEAIRSDAAIAPGEYEVTIFRADYPEHLVRNAIELRLGPNARNHLAVPAKIVLLALSIGALFVLFEQWLALLVIALLTAGMLRMFFKHPETKALQALKRSVVLDYPNIVVVMNRIGD